MNILLLKQVALFSALIGAAIGIITLIPYIGTISFLTLILFLSAIIIVYLKKNDLIGIINMKEGAILGAVVGFSSFAAFFIIYAPISMLIGAIGFNHVGKLITMFFTNFGGFFVLIMLAFFLALISAMMNAFSGITTAYVYEMLSGIKKAENENIDFEIKE